MENASNLPMRKDNGHDHQSAKWKFMALSALNSSAWFLVTGFSAFASNTSTRLWMTVWPLWWRSAFPPTLPYNLQVNFDTELLYLSINDLMPPDPTNTIYQEINWNVSSSHPLESAEMISPNFTDLLILIKPQ